MQYSEIYEWITQNQDRKSVLINLGQPLTAKQLGRKSGVSQEMCSYLLSKFAAKELCVCLNANAGSSRLYRLTALGRQLQDSIRQEINLPPIEDREVNIDWHLYGRVCYSQRALVLRSLTHPMQPAGIRRKIRHRLPRARISANNIRDIIKLFEKNGIVKKTYIKKKAHPRYELTETGQVMQRLLTGAETTN